MHRPCLEFGVHPLSVAAAVPSTKYGAGAPLITLVETIAQLMGLPRLDVGYSGPVGEAARAYLPRHYHPVPSNMLEGAHVLVIDDTWVSGARAESTATSLKWEGASRVTALTSVMWW